jgi:hypothetical protein
MAQSQVPEIRFEDLLRANSGPNLGSALATGIGSFQEGMTLAETMKMKRQQQALEMEKLKAEIAAAAQKTRMDEASLIQTEVPVKVTKTSAELQSPLNVPAQRDIIPGQPVNVPTVPYQATEMQPREMTPEAFKASTAKDTVTGASRPVPLGLELPDGTQVAGYFDTMLKQYMIPDSKTGEYVPAPPGTKRGYRLNTLETGSGDYAVTSGASGKVVGGISSASAKVPQEKYGTVMNVQSLGKRDRDTVINMVNDARNDENIKKARNLIGQMRNLRAQVVSDNKIAIDRLGGQIQKLVAGDSGNLAAWEQRDPNSRAVLDRFFQLVTMSASGQLLPENKSELIKLLDTVNENMKLNIDENADYYASSMVETFPQLNKAAMKRKIGIETYTKNAPKEEANGEMDAVAKVLGLKKKGQ